MKDVVFNTPNRGLKSAAEFIFAALNYGGPPRFSKIRFDLLHEDEAKCAALYDTKHKAGNENLISVETMQVCGDISPEFFLRTVVRTRSLRGSIKSHTMIPIPEKEKRFPEITEAWQEKLQRLLGHMTRQDLWNHLLDAEKLRRMPL